MRNLFTNFVADSWICQFLPAQRYASIPPKQPGSIPPAVQTNAPAISITHDPHACFIFETQTKSVYIHRDKQCPVMAYSIDVSLFTYSAIKHDSDRQIEV